MSHQCNDASCQLSHSHGSQGSCGCKGSGCSCSCHKCNCCSEGGGKGSCDKMEKLLALADVAWMEVLKDKIKERILSSDHKIDEIASIVAEVNKDLWHQKMAKLKTKEDFEQRLRGLFSAKH